MKLFEHPDFEQAIIRAAEHFHPRGLRESIIEKVSVRRVHPGPRPPKPTAREGDDTETGGRWGTRLVSCRSPTPQRSWATGSSTQHFHRTVASLTDREVPAAQGCLHRSACTRSRPHRHPGTGDSAGNFFQR